MLSLPDAERGGDDAVVADQRRHDGIPVRDAAADDVAIEPGVAELVQDEREPEPAHALVLLGIHGVEKNQRLVDGGGDAELRTGMRLKTRQQRGNCMRLIAAL